MKGAIIGDIVGSRYEFNNIKTKKFPLFSEQCGFTDDTVMTVAVARALMAGGKDPAALANALIKEMRELGRAYPLAGYGSRFSWWLEMEEPRPYNSYGNGSAMRVSPCGFFADTLEEALALAETSAVVTHNHPEGIKGAKATAAAIFLARKGAEKETIREYIRENFYSLSESLDEIRPKYSFDESCQRTVPQAIQAFLESVDFEDALRNAISLGGDSDTIGAITGGIAWAYYGRDGITADMAHMWKSAASFLPEEFISETERFQPDGREDGEKR